VRAISRRQLLVGGAAAAGALAVGAVAIERDTPRGQRLLHRVGLDPSPDRSVAASTEVRLEDGVLASTHMPGPVRWTIALPPPALGRPLGIVFCLHGRSGSHRDAFDRMRLHDEAVAAGVPLVLAGVDGGDHSYWHPRADGSDAMAMLTTEFMPLVAAKVGAAPTAVLGWSMGGYGALLLAESGLAGEGLRAVAAASPALFASAGKSSPGAFDDADDFRRHDVFAGRAKLARLGVIVHCGTGDPFYAATKRFAAGLPPAHQAVFGRGVHDDPYWRSIAPAQIRFLADALTR
jgi:S-formylglutathione hydrolase FrmB